MDTVGIIRQKAKRKLMTIALPEYNEARTIEAAKIIEKEGIAKVLLLAPDKIDPQDQERYIQEFYQIRQTKGIDMDTARNTLQDPLYHAAMMTREGKVDGFVAGAVHTTPDVARAAIRCLGVSERISIASSAFIMVVPNSSYGEKGTLIFSDCGVVPDANSRQLACISLGAAELAREVLGFIPRVALLSYSTKSSAKGRSIEKIIEALAILKEIAPGLLVDGELQVDAAIVPEVATIKYPDSILGGKANVLVFPNLDAGNISYKLVQRLANARAIGPILIGLNKPCSDLSRGCSVEDIVDCVAVTAIRAQHLN